MSRRKRGHRLPPGKFTPIYTEPLKKAAALLTSPEFRVYVCLCAQSQEWSNGTAKLTRSVLKEWRLASRYVASGIPKMIEAKLIQCTRRARQRVCAMYGVTYLRLNQDALARERGSDPDANPAATVSAVSVKALNKGLSASYSASAYSADTVPAQALHSASAKPESPALAQTHCLHNGHFSSDLAPTQCQQSKNLPSGAGDSDGGEAGA